MSAERTTARVLVADDDEDILELVRLVLEEDGYEVIGARDGEEALALATENLPDLCILDVMMPKLDGCEVTRRLRSGATTSTVPVILLSARTQWESVVRGREAGANEYITKPFVPDDLQREVRGLLAAPTSSEVEQPAALGLLPDHHLAGEEQQPARANSLVLVAAADEYVVKLVSYRLELSGCEVAAAHDPEEAVRLAAERPPDLCVMDSTMPEIVGPQVIRIVPPVIIQDLFEEVEGALADPAGPRSASGSG